MLEYLDDASYQEVGNLPYRPSYNTSLWVNDGYYTVRADGSVHHVYAYGQQVRTYKFPSPARALWGGAGISTYVLTLQGEQYQCTRCGPPRVTEPWDSHYYWKQLKNSGEEY